VLIEKKEAVAFNGRWNYEPQILYTYITVILVVYNERVIRFIRRKTAIGTHTQNFNLYQNI
jgi:hypothetical protein